MDMTQALTWAERRNLGVLITIRADGRPQSSDVVYAVENDAFVISLTDDRAKTRNMRKDPRVVLHVTDPSSWSYLSFDGTVELSPTAKTPGDPTADALVAYFEATNGAPHPDWAEFRKAMIDEQRLIATFTPATVVGQINEPPTP